MNTVKYIFLAFLLFFLINTSQGQSNQLDSLEYVLESLKAEKKTEALNALAKAYQPFSDSQSEDFTNKALILARETKNISEEAKSYNILGLLYLKNDDIGKAQEYINRALNTSNKSGSQKLLSESWRNLGLVYLRKDWTTEALGCFEEAKESQNRAGTEDALLECYYGEYHDLMNNIPRAKDYFSEALDIAERGKDYPAKKYIASKFAELLRKTGDIEASTTYSEIASSLNLKRLARVKFTYTRADLIQNSAMPVANENTKKVVSPISGKSTLKTSSPVNINPNRTRIKERTADSDAIKSRESLLYKIIIVLVFIIFGLGYFAFFIKNRYHKFENALKVKHREESDKLKTANFQIRNENKKRIKIEETLKQEKAFLTSLLDSIPDLIAYKDLNGEYLGCNKSYADFMGVTSDELVKKTDYQLFPKETADYLSDIEKKIRINGRSNRHKDWERNSYGKKFLIDSLKTPFYSANSEMMGIISIGRDMTAMKEAEEQIVKLSHAVEQNPVSIVITDIHGNVDYVNPTFERTTGYSKDEIYGKNLRILKSGQMSNDIYRDLWETISAGKTWSGELINKKKNGNIYWDNTNISPIFDKNGKITNYLATKEDISLKKDQEQELFRAKARAENANRAKTEFLESVSHETQTPMHGILGMVDILKDTPLTSSQEGFLSIIQSSANNLHAKINDLFDFSKLQEKNLKLITKEFSIHQIINDLEVHAQEGLKEKDVRLSLSVDKNIPLKVNGDALRLRQVLIHLLDNAIKFTQKGEINIEAKLDEISDANAKVLFKVKDTGIGISKAGQEKIFKPFQKEDDTQAREQGGLGLGLVISKEIVQLMKGKINVHSEEGKGSTFSFTAEFTFDTREQIITDDLNDCSDLRVLVIESDEHERFQLTRKLKEWNCIVSEAPTAQKGYTFLHSLVGSKKMISTVIVNNKLSDAEGITFSKMIKSDKLLQDCKLILTTAETTKFNQNEFLLSGYYSVFSKPFDFNELKQSLSSIKHKKSNSFTAKNISKTDVVELAKKSKAEVVEKQSSTVIDNKINSPASEDTRIINKPSHKPTASDIEKRETTSAKTSNSNQTIKALVVDDNLINRRVASINCKNLGYESEEAINGIEAVEKYKNGKFKFILMDIQMPEMDGYEATQKIREYEKENGLERTIIIALTANQNESGDKSKYFDAGMDEFIPKPFKPADLDKVIKNI